MAVTLKDVALKAGVSRAAVSRSFTPGASVSAKTRAKVMDAAEALGYSPNMLARSLTTRRTQLVGLIANNFRNPVFLQIFDLFTRGLQDAGLRPLLVNLSDETDPARSLTLLRQYSVDGVIVASSTLPEGFAAAFRQAGIPVVHAFGRATEAPSAPVVGIDNRHAGHLAAAALLARGYRRLGFLGGPEASSTTQDRMAGFLAEAARAGAAVSVHFAADYAHDAGRIEMAKALTTHRGADWAEAYFCGDDVLAIGAIAAIHAAGLQVPRDVGVIGLNDMDMAGWADIALTTIHQPFDAIVAGAIDLMRACLADPDRLPEARLYACHLVVRGTLR